jgi:hypothetical protein
MIGHSHGGSAIAYFLKEHPEAAKTLAGCAFLSTPFVAIRPRKEAHWLMFSLLYPLYFVFSSLWREIASPEWRWSIQEISNKTSEELTPVLLFQSFGFLVVAAILFFAFMLFRRSSDPQKVELSIRQQTADVPAGNYLFLRCSGDEAAAALSAAQFIAWLGVKVSTILKMLTRNLVGQSSGILLILLLYGLVAHALSVAHGLVGFGFLSHDGVFPEKLDFVHMNHVKFNLVSFVGLFLLISFIALFILIFCPLVVFLIFSIQATTSWTFGWTRLFTRKLLWQFSGILLALLLFGLVAHALSVAHGLVGFRSFLPHGGMFPEKIDFVHMTYVVFDLVSFLVLLLLLLCPLVIFLIFSIQAVTSWAFGWTRLFTGFLVELAIEPLPFGAHSLVNIDWADRSIGLDGIVHSWTYAHPAAIMHLQNWVRASLENCP